MADTLSAEELLTRASVPVVKSKGAPAFRTQTNRSLGGITPTMVVRHPDKDRKQWLDSKSSLETDYPLLSDAIWATLSHADKCIVLDVISDISYLDNMNLKADTLIVERDKVLSKFKDFLKDSTTHIQGLSDYKNFGHKSLESLLEEMDKGLAGDGAVVVPSEEDLQIATILKMAGHDVEFNGGKWNYREEVTPIVSYAPQDGDKKKIEVFSAANVQALCDYLNSPYPRDKQVVPSKLLQVYREVFQQQMTAGEQSNTEQTLNKRFVQEKNQIFSMNSDEFKVTRLLDNDTMFRNAQRMALVASFDNAFGNAPQTTELTDGMRKSLDALDVSDVYDRRLKHLDRLIGVVDRSGSVFEEMGPQGGYNVDYVAQYDEQIRRLEAQEPEGQLLAQVRMAKEAFLKTVAVQQVFWQSRMKEMIANNENIFGENLATTLNESMGFAVMQNEGGFNMADGDAVKKFFEERGNSETFEELKSMIEKGTSHQEVIQYLRDKKLVAEVETGPSTTQQQAQKPKVGTNTKYPEIFLQYLADVKGVDFSADSNLLLDYSNLRLYQFMWEKDGLFDVGFRALKAEKPEATIDDYIRAFIEEQHPEADFNPELIEDAYNLSHKDSADKGKLVRAQSKLDAFNEQLLISDLILKSFTPSELQQYNLLEDSAKTTLLKSKNAIALKSIEELKKNPQAYNSALDLAKKRHEAGIVGAVIKQKWSNTKTAEQEAGVDPLVSSAIDKFLSELGKEQNNNNKFLMDNGEPIVDNGQPQQEAQQQEASKKDGADKGKDPTFGDMFPSGPNVDQFLKKMKPYSAKAVKKNFIDKLLVDLDKIKINKEAYYARMFSSTSSSDVHNNSPQPTEDQKKAIEEHLQQQTQRMVAVKQRDFEASAFIPAYLMFERVRGGAKGKPEYEYADKLRNVFRYLATTGEIDASEKLGVRTPEGKDVRDDLRTLALKICGGGFKGKGAQGVQQELAPILTKYGVDAAMQEEIKDAFLFMTPETLAIALEPVSTVDKDNNLVIGSLLPHNLINAQNDRDRWMSFQREFSIDKHSETIEMLSGALGTIYRSKDGASVDKDSIDYAFDVEMNHGGAEYAQVKDKEQMKALIQKMRQQAEAALNNPQQNIQEEDENVM